MDLPDQSQWDETTCNSAICQHPQCWAAVRRIERGHPRILDSSCKTSLDAEDKLPMLTIVNISNSCFQTKRFAHQQSSEFTLSKAHSSLPRGAKLDLKCQGRPQKGLPDKGVISHMTRPPKVSVLNLNKTTLPFCEDVGNMIVTWIPEGTEKNASLARKTPAFSGWHGKKRRKKLTEKSKSSMYSSGRQYPRTHLKSPRIIVPPPSPVNFFEQLSSGSVPVGARADMLPQDLLKECILPHGEKPIPYPDLNIQLAKIKKNLPLEKDRPISAISSKMYLSIHRLTLQRPPLRYPEHMRNLRSNMKRGDGYASATGLSGHRKQQQQQQQQQQQKQKQKQRKVKTPTKKQLQETNKKVKSDTPSWDSSRQERDKQQQQQQQQLEQKQELEKQQVKTQRTTLKQVTIERSVADDSEYYSDVFTFLESSDVSETDRSTSKDVYLLEESMVESHVARQEKIPRDISESMVEPAWHPELKLLRILQATADEEDENQSSGSDSEPSLEE